LYSAETRKLFRGDNQHLNNRILPIIVPLSRGSSLSVEVRLQEVK
jgi:hypothetical protein